MIALLHQLEEDIGLLRLEVRVTHFIDQKDVQTSQAIHQPACRAIRQRSVHFIEQILCANELATQAVLQGLQQNAAGESRFAHASRADQHEVLALGHEVEFGERADLLTIYTWLSRERKRFESPAFRQARAADAPL